MKAKPQPRPSGSPTAVPGAAAGARLRGALPAFALLDDDPASGPVRLRPGVAGETDLLDAVERGLLPAAARVWEGPRAVVASRADARLPGFAEARRHLAAAGWPVAVRESGGAAVPHAPGILHLSLAFRPPEGAPTTLEAAYALLLDPFIRLLGGFGLRARVGEVPRSFCDGRFNLVLDGRKIAGTAQRWRARPGAAIPGRGAILAHALLLVDVDRSEVTGAVNRFYRLAGADRSFDADSLVTLAEVLPEGAPRGPALVEEVRRGLRDLLRAS